MAQLSARQVCDADPFLVADAGRVRFFPVPSIGGGHGATGTATGSSAHLATTPVIGGADLLETPLPPVIGEAEADEGVETPGRAPAGVAAGRVGGEPAARFAGW